MSNNNNNDITSGKLKTEGVASMPTGNNVDVLGVNLGILNNKLEVLLQKYENMENIQINVQKDFDEFKKASGKEQGKIKKRIERNKFDIIQIISIFITFFTFISVEFKILQNVTDFSLLLSLSLLLGGLLLFFICVICGFAEKNWYYVLLCLVGIVLIWGGIYYYGMYRDQDRLSSDHLGIQKGDIKQ